MTEPTLAMILRHAVEAYGTTTGAARCLDEEKAAQARSAFVWLARQLTQRSDAAIGLFIGLPQQVVGEIITAIDQQVVKEPMLREMFEEWAIELVAEAAVRKKVGRLHLDREPDEIAERILQGGASALSTGADHVAHLAAAYVAATNEIASLRMTVEQMSGRLEALQADPAVLRPDPAAAVVSAAVAFNSARFSAGERPALDALARAVEALPAKTEVRHAH